MPSAPSVKEMKGIKDKGGCALQCAPGCLRVGLTGGNRSTWAKVPKGAVVTCDSGYACGRCYRDYHRKLEERKVQREAAAAAPPARSTRGRAQKRHEASPLATLSMSSPLQQPDEVY